MKNFSHNSNDPVLVFDKDSTGSRVELLTIAEVAKLLNVSVTSVRRLQDSRHLPFYKIGGSIRFSKNDILAYLEKQRIEPID